MLRHASLILAFCMAIIAPAQAREERHGIDVPAGQLDQAVRRLGQQTRSSIGFRDRKLASLRVRGVRGEMTAGEAIVLMLSGSGARARRVAAESFIIEPGSDPTGLSGVRNAFAPASGATESTKPAPPPKPVEIVVTASKRDVAIGNYPGMVHVLEGDRISVASGRNGTDALAATSASVVSTHLGPGRNKLFIRGIADSSFVGPTQATVGQYWGNSRITYAAPDPSLRLYDVARIEVLEGPQGTLYGAGSLGGIVRVVPRAPALDRIEGSAWGGVEAVTHGEVGFDGGAVINVPIVTDRLAVRAVGFGAVETGYIDDLGRGLNDVNDVESYGGRVSLRYADNGGLVIDAGLVGQRIDGADGQYADRAVGKLERASVIAQPFRNDFLLGDFVARKRWGGTELTISAGYADQRVTERFEGPELADRFDSQIAPASDAVSAVFEQTTNGQMLTGEARLTHTTSDGGSWLVAASYLRNETEAVRRVETAATSSVLTGVTNTVEEVTVYGEGTLALADGLQLTAGGRFTSSRLSGSALDPVLPELVLSLDPKASKSRRLTEFLPSAALAWLPGDDLMLFLRYQEGFRPGGIAVRREFVQQFDSDHVRTFEAGARYQARSVQLEASASWTEWKDIQADLVDGFGFPTTSNIGNGRVFSLGLSGRWRPVRALELEASVYFNDSKVTRFFEIVSNLEDRNTAPNTERLPNIADAVAHVGANWRTSLGGDTELQISGHGRYVGKSILGVGELLGRLQGDYIDTGIEAELSQGPVQYSLSITNIFDSTGNRFSLGSPFQVRNSNQITPLRPRTFRLGVQVSF